MMGPMTARALGGATLGLCNVLIYLAAKTVRPLQRPGTCQLRPAYSIRAPARDRLPDAGPDPGGWPGRGQAGAIRAARRSVRERAVARGDRAARDRGRCAAVACAGQALGVG